MRPSLAWYLTYSSRPGGSTFSLKFADSFNRSFVCLFLHLLIAKGFMRQHFFFFLKHAWDLCGEIPKKQQCLLQGVGDFLTLFISGIIDERGLLKTVGMMIIACGAF